MGITIKDVAAAAKVSAATVSRVLAESDKVSPGTLEHVRKVIGQLGYKPDRIARALRQKRSGVVGCIFSHLSGLISLRMLGAVQSELSHHDLLLLSTGSVINIQTQIEHLTAYGIDGLFIQAEYDPETEPSILEAAGKLPVVRLACCSDQGAYDSVSVDYEAGVGQMVRYLAGSNCRRPAFIGRGTKSEHGRRIMEAFVDAVAQNGCFDEPVLRIGAETREFGRQVTAAMLSDGRRPDAVICENGEIAEGSIESRNAAGIDSKELRIIGIESAYSTAIIMRHTSYLAFPAEEMSQEAVRLMLERISGIDSDPADETVVPNLVIRGSG